MNQAIVETGSRLTELEAVIEGGMQTFIEVGAALAEIGADKLYRKSHATFEDYCRERWGMSKSHAYRLIQGVAIVDRLSPMGDKPISERQVRPLMSLPPAEQPAAWAAAVQLAESTNNGKVTGKIVETVIGERVRHRNGERMNRLPIKNRTKQVDQLVYSLSVTAETLAEIARVLTEADPAWCESLKATHRQIKTTVTRLERLS